jgi:hypothetical protein
MDRLLALWDDLEKLGATVRRLPLEYLTDDEIAALCAGEAERFRILSAPEARCWWPWARRRAA